MRHLKKGRKLNRTRSHRKAMLSNMAASLVFYKRIRTTLPKAKTLSPFVERLITESESELGKNNFAVAASRIKSINWLFLKSNGNISAEFNFTENGIIQN